MKILVVSNAGTLRCGIAFELQRLADMIAPEPMSGCWLWAGGSSAWNYGYVWFRGRTRRVHRVVYELTRGSIPEGMTLDHRCRNTWCVNPDHLEVVTMRENTLRGVGPSAINAKKEYCARGHLLAGENLRRKRGPFGSLRVCRACTRAQAKARFRLFQQIHPPENRREHWQGRKPSTCPHCQGFLTQVRTV